MEQTEILEGNRLIAEFMGLKVELNYEDNTVVKGNKMLTVSANRIEPFVYIQPTFMHVAPLDSKTAIEEMVTQKIWRNIERLSKYHLSWDWLMPVIEKIEDNKAVAINTNNWNNNGKYQCRIFWCYDLVSDNERQEVVITTGDNKIEVVWQAVIKFINWYKQNNG